jgi:DNA polymerase-3 subunit gamma/tau
LLDQAIAYGAGAVRGDDVRAMLGSVARAQVLGVLDAVAAGDGARLLRECTQIASYSPDFGGVLDDLAGALHQLQLLQLIPGYQPADGADDDHALAALAAQMAAEDVQLYYQIAVAGRRDLTLAPDARTGFEMALLRMLAFRPDGGGSTAARAPSAPTLRASGSAVPAAGTLAQHPPHATKPPTEPGAVKSAPVVAAPAPTPAPLPVPVPVPAAAPDQALAPVALDVNGLPDWEALIARAALRGPLGLLAQNAVLRAREGQTLVLALQPVHLRLAVEPMVSQMEEHISQALGESVHLRFVAVSSPAAAVRTPAARAALAHDVAQAAAVAAIESDPLVQSLQREFGAQVMANSIKPLANESGAV